MSTVQQILDRVNLYRNAFSAEQIVGWMDTVQRQIFQDAPHEAPPYSFTTINGFAFYAIPSDCDPLGIKLVTIETKAGSEKYNTLDFIAVSSTTRVSPATPFYSVQGNENIFINPMPTSQTEGRKVYVTYNKRPAQLSSSNLNAVPDLEEDFHELIELGAKVRVARERGEVTDKNNFEADFKELFVKYKDRYAKVYPEYPRIKNTIPNRNRYGRRGARISDLIPHQ